MRALFPIPQKAKQAVNESRSGRLAYRRVLAVVTGEAADEGVLAHAADLVRPAKGRLDVLYVIEVDRSLPVDAEIAPASAKGEDILQLTEQIVRLPKGEFDAHMVQARELGPAVVAEAVSREVDAIVIGTPYHRRYGAFSLGEEVSFVLENAPCLVILRREPPRDVLGPSFNGARDGGQSGMA